MVSSELIYEMQRDLESAIDSALEDKHFDAIKKKAQALADDIVSDVEWSLKDNLSSNLSHHVKDMAERTIKALIDGNTAEMIRWLSCDSRGYTGRSDGYSTSSIEDQHPIIHGVLHENSTVALRRKLFDAHRDLIVSERIKDLEDQVASLVAQNNEMRRQRDALSERIRNGD